MSTNSNISSSEPEESPSGSSEQTFTPPELEEYGTIEDLTRGPRGGTIDQLTGGDGGFEDGGGGTS